jgi:hypothetical protein
MTQHTAFWDDVADDLEDPEFRREFLAGGDRVLAWQQSADFGASRVGACVASGP